MFTKSKTLDLRKDETKADPMILYIMVEKPTTLS